MNSPVRNGRHATNPEPTTPATLLTWRWPTPPQCFTVFDKYADEHAVLGIDEPVWKLPLQGKSEQFRFWPGEHGQLQRTFIALTQADKSPSTIAKFARSILRNWNLYCRLLGEGPDAARRQWSAEIHDIDTAKAGKTVLRLACDVAVGKWGSLHVPLVRSLDTQANKTVLSQRSSHARRASIISVEDQARIARVLDEAALRNDLSAHDVEVLAALALMFQHGVRPVQVLSLRREHVRLIRDAGGELNCIVSFHAAKRHGGETIELVRQMKPEWTSLMSRTLTFAEAEARSRVLRHSDSNSLWAGIKRVCTECGVHIAFTANALRHTGAQALADAGHDRRSIRHFLGHGNDNAATVYVKASRKQAALINTALGVSKLYANILSLADARFVSVREMLAAAEGEQVGAVVGERFVAGVGLCRSGQDSCPYNPVTSCYGCRRFIPSLDRSAHEEAVAGMREQVLLYVRNGGAAESPAQLQLTRALSGAQQVIEAVDRINAGGRP